MNICLTFTPFETTTHGLPILTSNSPPQASIVTKELGTPTVFYEACVHPHLQVHSTAFYNRIYRVNKKIKLHFLAVICCKFC
ncbi:hypothetical protein PVK06_034968 [Gossypium arboreum]|uniref:Uncharacterized protein n=1 Tax=Gossypium arboreum TaxID=29729 RepID=A0ABR0NG46_GOSAR|nr:hypothetical protein PVK06_034968 [Gossypium arboreum]